MAIALSALQALGVLAVLVGVVLALPLWGALVADGVLVVVAATAVELVVQRRLSVPSDRRDGTDPAGGE